MPAGREQEARRSYGDALQMTELPKPPALATRGGCWFRAGDVELHLGVEPDFRPARKAHPALIVDDLDGLQTALEARGLTCTRSDIERPGVARCHTLDPFGNRIEFQQA